MSNILMNSKAQGTIEYLVILAVVVVISLVVVSLMTSSAPSDSISSSTNKISSSVGSGSISVTDVVLDSEGDGLITVSSVSGEPVSLKKIVVGEQEVEYADPKLSSTPSVVSFNLETTNACSCEGRTGTISCPVTIYQESSSGIESSSVIEASVDCVSEAIAVADEDDVITPSYSCTGSIPFDATLCEGDLEGLIGDTGISVVDSCGEAKCEYECNEGFSKNADACTVNLSEFLSLSSTSIIYDNERIWQAGDSGVPLVWDASPPYDEGYEECQYNDPDFPACYYCSNLALCNDYTLDETGACSESGILIGYWNLPTYNTAPEYYQKTDYYYHQDDLTGFFGTSDFTQYDYYWAATADGSNSDNAYAIDLTAGNGTIFTTEKDGSYHSVRARCAISTQFFLRSLPTSDAGVVCTDSDQCQSHCEAVPSNTPPMTEATGACYPYYDTSTKNPVEDGIAQGLRSD
jgi:hypothetical protein